MKLICCIKTGLLIKKLSYLVAPSGRTLINTSLGYLAPARAVNGSVDKSSADSHVDR